MTQTLSYFERRAEIELEMAQRATHPAVVHAHYCLADLYLDRVYGAGQDAASAEADRTDPTEPDPS